MLFRSATAVNDAVSHPLKALANYMSGARTEGPMAPEISLDRQRPAQYVFSSHVEKMLHEIDTTDSKAKVTATAKAKEPVAAK